MELVSQHEGHRPRGHKQLSLRLPTWTYNLTVPGPASPHGHTGTEAQTSLHIWPHGYSCRSGDPHSHWGELSSLESGVAQLGCRESGCPVLPSCSLQTARCCASWARLNHRQDAAISPWCHLLAVGRCQSVLLSNHRAVLKGEAGETGKALDLESFSLIAKTGATASQIPVNPLCSPSSNKLHRFGDDVLSNAKPIAHGKVSILGNPLPFTVTCLTALRLELGCSLSPLHVDFQDSLSPKATILG